MNYEPNSCADEGGPREEPGAGFTSFPAPRGRRRPGRGRRLFADHYSQARQFYESQTVYEQAHIAEALVFEL